MNVAGLYPRDGTGGGNASRVKKRVYAKKRAQRESLCHPDRTDKNRRAEKAQTGEGANANDQERAWARAKEIAVLTLEEGSDGTCCGTYFESGENQGRNLGKKDG